MSQRDVSSRQNGAVLAVYFLSGTAGLILQISWSRQIGLLLGQTVHAASTVLAAWFAGMAIGYLVGARNCVSRKPLTAYGCCELLIGLWAMLVPYLLTAGELPAVAALLGSGSPGGRLAMRSLFCFILLLPATVAMGATLPLMAEYLSRQKTPAAGRVTLAYGVNTIGAVAGVLAASFVLLVDVGVRGSGLLAGGIAIACGLTALVVARREIGREECRAENGETRPAMNSGQPVPRQLKKWIVFAALCGFATIALEVLYTRLFSLVFHNSTYTFAAVVAVFLAGLGIGSLLVTWLSRRYSAIGLLATASGLSALAIVASIFLFVGLTQLRYFQFGDTFVAYFFGSLGLVGIVAGPPAVLAGIALPSLWHASAPSTVSLRSAVGFLTFSNTVAAAGGAVATTFLFLPAVGMWTTFGIVALVMLAIAVVQLATQAMRIRAALLAVVGLSVVLPAVALIDRVTRSRNVLHAELMVRRTSAYGWIDTVRTDDGAIEVRQNLHYRHGATGKNAIREYRQTHIPLLLHPHPQDVLFLGLGTGLTAGPAVTYPEVERVRLVELVPEVVAAARSLKEYNDDIVDHDKSTVQIGDARHFLATTESRFDVIISDLFVPWESQTGYLYTVEHYRSARARLKPGGLFCQWLPVYQLSEESFELIADSFASVFPETTIWWGRLNSDRPIVALIGSVETTTVDANVLARRFSQVPLLATGQDFYLSRASDLKRLYLGRWPVRDRRVLNTDEHPRVEFRSPFAQWDDRLLQGRVFRDYFDRVWMHLPAGGVRWGDKDNTGQAIRRRRLEQRVILFRD